MNNQKGFTLLELVITIVVFTLAAYALTRMMLDRSNYAESVTVAKNASDAAENALKTLAAASFSDLPVGGSFTASDGESITLGGCTPQTCDYVVEADTPGGAALPSATSPAGGAAWQANYSPPAGTRAAYLRRWNIEEFSADLRLRRITLAVLTDGGSSKPLVMVNTIVGDK